MSGPLRRRAARLAGAAGGQPGRRAATSRALRSASLVGETARPTICFDRGGWSPKLFRRARRARLRHPHLPQGCLGPAPTAQLFKSTSLPTRPGMSTTTCWPTGGSASPMTPASAASPAARSPASTRRAVTRPRSSRPGRRSRPEPCRPCDVLPLAPGELLQVRPGPLWPRCPRLLRDDARRPRPAGGEPRPAQTPTREVIRRPGPSSSARADRRPGQPRRAAAPTAEPSGRLRGGKSRGRTHWRNGHGHCRPRCLSAKSARKQPGSTSSESGSTTPPAWPPTTPSQPSPACSAPHYARAEDEARSLLRETYRAPGDLEVVGNELHVRIAPLSAPGVAPGRLAALCPS